MNAKAAALGRALSLCALLLAACQPSDNTSPPPGPDHAASVDNSAPRPLTTATAARAKAPASASSGKPASPSSRIVAIGDLHGDYQATREVLRLAALIDQQDRWIGGAARMVQLGDFLDRGDGEKEIIAMFERLRGEAKLAGGEVHILNGNHELMNAARRFPYVTPKGFSLFAEYDDGDPTLRVVVKERRGRWAAFRPGGHYAKILAQYPVVLRLGDTVFVHGGLLPKHVEYGVERINQRARDFLLGNDDKAWGWFAAWDSPVNSRHYGSHPGAGDCYLLDKALQALGAKRMVVGHTVQLAGVSSYCGEHVWAVDVGLSSCCGDKRQVLVIDGDDVTVAAR